MCQSFQTVNYIPLTNAATWNDISNNIGDQPVTSVVRDDIAGDLFIATDFGIFILVNGSSTWALAADGLPPVTVYGLTIDNKARILYAATHGRGAWRLNLSGYNRAAVTASR
jgi:hypothetical protein